MATAAKRALGLAFFNLIVGTIILGVISWGAYAMCAAFSSDKTGKPDSSGCIGVLAGPMVGLLLLLVLPCCGYQGAKQNNSTMLCCFCGCNGCLGIMGIVSLVASLAKMDSNMGPVTIIGQLVGLSLNCAQWHYGRSMYNVV